MVMGKLFRSHSRSRNFKFAIGVHDSICKFTPCHTKISAICHHMELSNAKSSVIVNVQPSIPIRGNIHSLYVEIGPNSPPVIAINLVASSVLSCWTEQMIQCALMVMPC